MLVQTADGKLKKCGWEEFRRKSIYALILPPEYFEEPTDKVFYITRKGNYSTDVANAKKFKSLFGMVWWVYWCCRFTPFREVNIRPYMDAFEYVEDEKTNI